jgi:hypothetical protein
MSLERGIQIDVGDDLSVDDDKRLTFKEGTRVIEGATRAEYYRFIDVMKLHTKSAAIAQRFAN